MALGEEGDGAQAAPPPTPPPGSSGDEEGSLGAPWAAVLLALLAALLSWLWYGRHDGKEAAKATPRQQEPAAREKESPPPPELQGSRECVISEAKSPDASNSHEAIGNQLGPPGDHCTPDIPQESSEVETTTAFMNYKEYLSSEAFSHPAPVSKPLQSQDAEMHGTGISSEPDVPSVKHERCKEQLLHNSLDHEEWEMVPEHSLWPAATRKRSSDDASNSSRDLDQAKRVAAVSPMPQTVHVTFRVHYITHAEAQLIAITGDHECLGQWHHYLPLRCDKDGFWSDAVVLPVDTRLEWKFIVVENGKVRRWEECDNRVLVTENEDRVAHKWWGYH